MRFVPIDQVEEKAQYKFVPLDTVVPPQGNFSAPPTAAVTSEPAGGEAAGSVLDSGAAFGIYPSAIPRRDIAPPTPVTTFKAGTPGFSVLGQLPPPSPLPVGVNPDFVTQTRAEMLRATPAQRTSMLNGGGMKATVVKSLLDAEPKTFAAPRSGVMKNTDASTAMGMDIRQAVPNPAARGVIAALTGLGQVLPGVVQAGADLVGADALASKAGQVAGFGRDMADPLRPSAGNDKIAFDVFNSIIQSAPTMVAGLAGAGPMRLLFAQTSAQEYSEGRSKGLSGAEAATRAGTMAGAEVLGERLGLTQQLKILRGLTQGMPTNELAPTLAKMIVREVPGEQLTTGLRFLGDKYGVGALNPQATLEQYFKDAGDTLVTTIGQAGLMGAGPTLVRAGINETRRQEANQLSEATDALPLPTALARADREQPAPLTPAPAPGPLPVDQRIEPTMRFVPLDEVVPADVPAPVEAAAPAPIEQPAPAPAEPVATLQPPQGTPNELRQEGQEAPQAVTPPSEATDTQRVSTVTGRQVETRMRVVDASDLQAATGDMQPRDRTRASSDEQINAIASQLDPQRLGQSTEADRGAPIIGPDMIVESGNGRVQAVRRAFEMFPEKAQAYRDYLGSLGYDTTGIATPVLVRERVTPMTQDERIAFVQEANRAATMALTPVERAKMDVSAMTDATIDVWRGGDVGDAQNRDFVSAFMSNLPQTERNEFMDDNNRLSPDGQTRIRRALLAAAYDDRELLGELINSADDNLRGIGNALFDSAAPWLQMRRMARDGTIDPAYDTTVQLVQAARTVSQLRKQKQSVADWLIQEDLTNPRNDVVDAFVRGFYNEKLTRAVGREAINDVIQNYAKVAKEQDTTSMFGAPPTPVEVARGAVELRNEANRGAETAVLFDKSEGADGAGPGIQRGRRQAQPDALQGSGQGSDRQGQGGQVQRAAAGRPAQGQDDEGRRDQAKAGEVNERASGSNRDDAGTSKSGGTSRRQDNGAAKNQRVKGAGNSNQFQEASFTNRRSLFTDAYEDLGLGDAAAIELLPPVRRYAILAKAVKEKYGLASVQKSDNANIQKSIDQLLDAYRNLKFMTAALDLPPTAIGLDGTLALALTSQGKFLGAYFPKGSDGKELEGVTTNTPTIGLPGRSNSFAHEWGHALDYFILDRKQGVLGNLSGFIRKGESLSDQVPTELADSFKLLMNSLFFDKAEQSARILDLESRIEAAAKKGIDATKLKADLKRVQDGASQSRVGQSEFYRTSSDYGNNPDYWRKPTEMLARSFEAYVAHKVEGAGGTTEFIAKGDDAYMSNADERLAKTFPKDADRYNIFRAYDLMFDALRADGLLGRGPVDMMPTAIGPVDLNALFLPADQLLPKGKWRDRIFDADKRAIRARAVEIKLAEGRPKDPRTTIEGIGDFAAAALGTNRGNLLRMESAYRAAGNTAAADGIWEITKRIANDPGSGREGFKGGYFAEVVRAATSQYYNRLGVIAKNNDIDLMNADELAQLTDVLTAIGDEAASAPANIRQAALELSGLMKDFWYYMDRAGLDVGFIKDQGYLPRMIDSPLVEGDPSGFLKAATAVYKIKFERDVQRPSDADDLAEVLNELQARAKSSLVPSAALAEFKKALKELSRLNKALDAANKTGDGDAMAAAQGALDEFLDGNMEIFEEAYDTIGDAWSETSADAYRQNILYGTNDDVHSSGLSAPFMKGRELPPEADKLLAPYYITNPVERIERYVDQGVRKAEYNARFGSPKGKGESQLSRLTKALTAAGVRPQDSSLITKIVDQVTGNNSSGMPDALTRGLSVVHTTITMTQLARVLGTSLAEPATVAIQTGRPTDALKSLVMTVREIAGGKEVRERRALMNAMGIVSSDAAVELVGNRLGGTFGESASMQKRSSVWYRRVGLTGYTNASRRSSGVLASRYILDMANAVSDPEVSAKEKGYARAELIDAGLTQDQLDDFVSWAKEFADRNPTTADILQGNNGDLTNMGRIYSALTHRLVNQSIQEVTAIDRPWGANTNYGRIIFGLMSFSMAFQRNVLIKSAKRIDRIAETEGWSDAAKFAAKRMAPSFAALYATHFLTTVLREALLNPDKWEEELEREKAEYLPLEWLGKLAFSRAGFTGMGDPVFNAIESVRYQRDFSNIMVGPSVSYISQNIDRLIKFFKQNSDINNNGERQAVKAIYELTLPALTYVSAGLPAGPLVGYGLGAVNAYLSSPAQKDFIQDVVAGKKEDKAKTSKAGDKKEPSQGGGFR